jgi:nicotinate-nucleotide adenylyltransferase
MKIALFGTSADPPTIAHQEIIIWLASQFDRVAVWAADNPFKEHGASLIQRSQMLELLIGEVTPSIDTHAQVYPNLSSRRTVETLSIAQTIWSDAQFTLTIGADLVTQLPKWYRIGELLSQVDLLIVARDGNPIDKIDIDRLTNLGAKISFAPLTTPPVSSTIIRTIKSRNITVDSLNETLCEREIQGLTSAVATYIQQHSLYSKTSLVQK